MTRFRPFRNGDPPALAELWKRGLPVRGVARRLGVHDFDSLIVGKLHFEAAGLIVAECDGRIVGFAHAGFGPEQPEGPSHRLSYELGTVGMLVVAPDQDDPELEHGLLVEAERYLLARGASVIYAGGQYPLNPFYWGLYGGSEWAGILSSHSIFHRAVQRAGYEPVATTALLEADLTRPEVRDPMAPVIRRRARTEIFDDADYDCWWDSLALGLFHTTAFRLVERSTDCEVAWARTWDMSAACHGEGRGSTGLITVEVEPAYRHQGLGRHLIGEIIRHCREQMGTILSVQTSSTNTPALALYKSLGFVTVDTSSLYRLPARQGTRPAGERCL
ncbi:MAG TPA: GNAT family N-acetyltransferase [Isosphaeraceae bacterium]|nr:GNAT family N-acetyltransferase [Isosphaeraceae bacterium]